MKPKVKDTHGCEIHWVSILTNQLQKPHFGLRVPSLAHFRPRIYGSLAKHQCN